MIYVNGCLIEGVRCDEESDAAAQKRHETNGNRCVHKEEEKSATTEEKEDRA